MTWTKDYGVFPTGVSLSTDGVLAGVPTESGTFNFSIKVKDSTNKIHTRDFVWKVNSTVLQDRLSIIDDTYTVDGNSNIYGADELLHATNSGKNSYLKWDLSESRLNLFSLASGGAIYVRDPHKKLSEDQLNGGEFAEVEDVDWQAIIPYLDENERQFGIKVEQLLSGKSPSEVYRKIQPKAVRAVQAEEAWVHNSEQ